jgi:hypothetical protein
MAKRASFLSSMIPICLGFVMVLGNAGHADMKSDFANPPLKYRPIGFNKAANANTLLTTSGLGGISEMGDCSNYRTPAFFHNIHTALATIKQLGGSYTIYDESQFPSGSAGNGNANHGGICNPPAEPLLATLYPDNTIKRLDKIDHWVMGPTTFSATVENGGTTTLMAIVAMDTADKPPKLIDLTDSVKGTTISWNVPAGKWDVIVFECLKDGNVICDYMDSVSVNLFVHMAYQPYFDSMPEYCGNTITQSWYDEPSLIQGSGRPWTPLYNKKFVQKYGFSPTVYYPALWYDIGPQTKAARNYLFGFRAELFSRGFIKQVNAWCDAHGIRATGHLDNEDWTCPVGSTGDVIKAFQYSSIPGLDDIGYAYTHLFYKLFSSAAYNWDKTLVGIENGGDYGKAIEQLADGIQIQHCFSVPALTYNQWFGRCGVMLQPAARHVADIAVLYPIATCQGTYYFGSSSGPSRDTPVAEADYDTVGNILSSEINRDFTWIHPDVLDGKCTTVGPIMKLGNTLNHEEYKVFIIPGHVTIAWSNLQKIKQFYDGGGQVIATGTLPSKSAEFGHDSDVVNAVKAMFPATGQTLKNASGGSAVFLGTATAASMLRELDNAIPAYDVQFEPETGGLRYIHKVLNDSLNIYFFGNNTAATISAFARLRGNFTPQLWDPHTGLISTPQYTQIASGGTTITRIPLTLTALHSVFITGAYSTSTKPVHSSVFVHTTDLSVAKTHGNTLLLTYCVSQGAKELVSVTIHVFDARGARIATLVDGLKNAGTHTATWQAARIPAGTYLVRLKVDGQSAVIRKVAIE